MGDREGDERLTGGNGDRDSDSVTIRVPKKVLFGSAIVVAVTIAFLVGRGCSESGDRSPQPISSADESVPTDSDCPNSQTIAISVRSSLDPVAKTKSELQDRYGPGPAADASFEILGCRDLNDDGKSETVAIATPKGQPAGPPMVSWFILDSDLKVVARRTVPDPKLEMAPGGIKESTATYEPTKANAPADTFQETGRREGLVQWDGAGYIYVPAQGSRQRSIKINNEGKVEQLGPFRDFSTSPPLASDGIAVLGPPSTITRYGTESCSLIWYDLGLQILFVTFGGGSGCTSGLLQSAHVFDDVGRMAGWSGPLTLRVGQTTQQVKAAFPMDPLGYGQDDSFVLVYGAYYPYGGYSQGTPTVISTFVGNRLYEVQFWTGAAGD